VPRSQNVAILSKSSTGNEDICVGFEICCYYGVLRELDIIDMRRSKLQEALRAQPTI
jgi:hypothetical protein